MAIPVQRFEPMTWQQANPYTAGMAESAKLVNQLQANRFQPAELRGQLEGQNLKNQLAQITNQFEPQNQRANLQKTLAGVNLTNAQAEAERNYPLKTGLPAAMLFAENMGRRYGYNSEQYRQAKEAYNVALAWENAKTAYYGANVGLKNLPNTVKNEIIAEGAPVGGIGLSAPPSVSGVPGSVASQGIGPGATAPSPNQAPPQGGQPGRMSPIQNPQNTGGLRGGLAGYTTPGIQNAAASAVIKETVPGPIQTQRQLAINFENMLSQVEPNMPIIAKYAGALGQTNMTLDKWAASSGAKSSPDYEVFNNFMTAQGPTLAREMGRLLGRQATDAEAIELDKIVTPQFWKENPQLALSQFNTMMQMARQVEKGLAENPVDVRQQLMTDSQKQPLNTQIQQAGSAPKTLTPLGKDEVLINWNGQVGRIPKSKLKDFEAQGAKVVK